MEGSTRGAMSAGAQRSNALTGRLQQCLGWSALAIITCVHFLRIPIMLHYSNSIPSLGLSLGSGSSAFGSGWMASWRSCKKPGRARWTI